MKTTRYFDEQVLRKRPYIQPDACERVIATALKRVVQPDGRVRYWGAVTDPRDGKRRIMRVVTLEDGQTVHNAFFDRDYREDLK
ncbi:MAG: hypothetical protein ACREEB_05335 [Caulobacteraceae bacterium]